MAAEVVGALEVAVVFVRIGGGGGVSAAIF